MSLRWVYHHRKENWRLYRSEIIGTASPRFACPETQQNTTTFYHDRFVLLYYHLLVGTADLFFAWRYLFLLLSGSGREMMRYPISGSLQSCRIRLYITSMLAIVQSKFFSLFACSWWRMVMARRGLFFSLRRLAYWKGVWRSIERAGRYLSAFLAFFRLYVFYRWDLLVSHQNIQTTKVQTFTSLPFSVSEILTPLNLPLTYLLSPPAHPLPILDLPITPPPYVRQYHPTLSPLHSHVIISPLNLSRKNPSPSSRTSAQEPDGWERRRSLSNPCPISQPALL